MVTKQQRAQAQKFADETAMTPEEFGAYMEAEADAAEAQALTAEALEEA